MRTLRMIHRILILAALLLVGLLWIGWAQPRWVFSIYTQVNPGAVFFVPTNEKIVALTIDDGPDPRSTPAILHVLAQNRARATFFLISNQVMGVEGIVSALARQGHEIGNHLVEDEPSILLSAHEFETRLREADQILSAFAPLYWFRPGGGWYSQTMVAIAHQQGYQVALGSVFPYDTHIKSTWFATTSIVSNVRPGSIIVLHEGNGRGLRTAETLTKVLPALKRRGYRVVSLSELMRSSR